MFNRLLCTKLRTRHFKAACGRSPAFQRAGTPLNGQFLLQQDLGEGCLSEGLSQRTSCRNTLLLDSVSTDQIVYNVDENMIEFLKTNKQTQTAGLDGIKKALKFPVDQKTTKNRPDRRGTRG